MTLYVQVTLGNSKPFNCPILNANDSWLIIHNHMIALIIYDTYTGHYPGSYANTPPGLCFHFS